MTDDDFLPFPDFSELEGGPPEAEPPPETVERVPFSQFVANMRARRRLQVAKHGAIKPENINQCWGSGEQNRAIMAGLMWRRLLANGEVREGAPAV